MSEDTPAQDQAMGQPAAMAEHQRPYQQLHQSVTPEADALAQQQQEFAQAPYQQHGVGHAVHHKGTSTVQAQHDMPQHDSMQQQAQHARHAAGMWRAGPMLRPYGPAHGWHGAPNPAGHHAALPAAYSRMSLAGDAVADAQRQSDQCMAPPAVAGLPAQQHVAWGMQRAAMHTVGCAGQRDLDAAKLTVQADQHTHGQQAQTLSVEPVLPPNLKRLRTSAVDKMKQSGAPGEDLSTFIPTPTWGSPRVAELQPTAVGAGSSTGGNRSGPGGLAGRAAHAASLLAQAAANCAARSNSIAAAAAAGHGDHAAHDERRARGEDSIPAGGSSRGLEQRGGSQSRQGREAAAAAAAGAAGARDVPGDTQPVPHLASLLRQQRSDDELAAQYRLELQQMKAEHAALQMLTQHAEQETRPRAMVAHEVVLPTPGMPRSLEGEAERLAAKMLKQAGGDWKASMAAMMDLLRSNMQQGSQLLRGCTKAHHQHPQAGSTPDAAAAATAAAASEHHTWGAAAGDDDAAVARSQDKDPAAAEAEAAMEEDGEGAEEQGPRDAHMQDWAAAAATAADVEGPEGQEQQQHDAQGSEQQQEDAGAPAGRQLRRRRSHWLQCSDHEDTASQSSSHLERHASSAAAAAAAAGAAGGYHTSDAHPAAMPMQRSLRSCRKQAAAAGDASAAAHGPSAAAEAAAAAAAAAALYSEQAPAAGSRHGSPMRSACADNGYNSPAVSTAVGPSPFSATAGSPSATPHTMGGGMMRTRTLTRRQSRLAPKPAPSGVAADTEAAAFEAAIAAAAAGPSTEPSHADAPMLTHQAAARTAAAADPRSCKPQSLGCVLRSRARKSPPATTPTPGRTSARLAAASTTDAAAGQQAAMQGHAMQFAPAGAFAGGGPSGNMQQHSAYIPSAEQGPTGNCTAEQCSPQAGSAPAAGAGAVGSAGVCTAPAAAYAPGGQAPSGYTCSAAAAAAAFAAGAEWAPGWGAPQHGMQQDTTQHSMPQQAPGRAAGVGLGPKPQGLTVDTDCGGLDEQDWICLGLLDTPGPTAAAAAAAGVGSGPSGGTQGVASAAAAAGSNDVPTAGAANSLGRQQQQHELECQPQQLQQQLHMGFHDMAGMHPPMVQDQHGGQPMQMQQQVPVQGGLGPGYWMGAAPLSAGLEPSCTGHMQHAASMPTGDAAQSQAASLPGMMAGQQMQAGGGYGHMHWQQMHGSAHAMAAGVGAVGVQGAAAETGSEGQLSPEAAEAALAALMAASNMQDLQQGQHMLQQQQQQQHHMGLQLQQQQQYMPQQQQMMYHSQQQMDASQQQHPQQPTQQQHVVPAGSTPAATVADQELLNMLIGWSK